MVTAGVVATVEDWDAFDERWLAVLRKYEIGSFHMTQIAHWEGDIAAWPLKNDERDENRRRQFLSELASSAKGVSQAVIRGIVLSDYRAANQEHALNEAMGGPYTMAQAICLLNAAAMLREKCDPATTQFGAIIEAGDAGQGRFREFCNKVLTVPPTFTGKKAPNGEDVTPLSLADLLAYEHHLLYSKRAALGPGAVGKDQWRGILRVLRETIPTDARIVEQAYLQKFCTTLNLKVRATE